MLLRFNVKELKMLVKAIDEMLYWSSGTEQKNEQEQMEQYIKLKERIEKEIDYYDFATQEN